MQKIKCWICGEEATETRAYDVIYLGDVVPKEVSKYTRCYCAKCKAEVDEQEKADRELYIKLKKREMFRRACNLLEKQNTNMYKYKEAIEAVQEFVEEQPDKFDSSYEVLAAIVLIHNRIHCKMQYKVGRYQVDFCLPELFVLLEIDGDRHKYKKEQDSERDRIIKKTLGPVWDIVRINTEYLDMNAKKLPDAIQKVIDYRETGHVNWRSI